MVTALRVLIIEDHLALRLTLAQLFETHGHHVDFAADGVRGLQLALHDPPDVIVLDLGLPGMDGIRVCQQVRTQADRHIPILMLTARDTLNDKLQGFTAGADDYLLKPFANEELLARCAALSMRHRLGTKHKLILGSLSIDRSAGLAYRFDRALDLQRIPLLILIALAEAWPRVLSRSALIDKIWPEETPPSDPLRSHMYSLRLALDKPFHPPMLVTVHGVGFRLDTDLTPGSAGLVRT